jgi:ribosomal-protein-alanine acetyltransferase
MLLMDFLDHYNGLPKSRRISMAEIIITPADSENIEDLLAIENRCFESDRISRRSFRYLITRGHARTLVAKSGGRILGYVIVLFSRGTTMARVYSLAVDPDARGQGIGRMLVEAAENAAKSNACSEIRLEVRKDNATAIALYQTLKFKPFGVLSEYYEDHQDALRFHKSIAPQLDLHMVRVPYYGQTLDFTCGPACLMMAMAALRPEMSLNRKLELRLWREANTVFMNSGHGGCGPLGLALAAWNRGFGAEIFMSDRGTLLIDSVRNQEKKEVMRLVQEDMLEEAIEKGIPIHHTSPGVEELERMFTLGSIPIVLISSYRIYRERFPHWVVVTGFAGNYIYVHDPYIDIEQDETLVDSINMPIVRRDFTRMARYGKANLRTVVVIHPSRKDSICHG